MVMWGDSYTGVIRTGGVKKGRLCSRPVLATRLGDMTHTYQMALFFTCGEPLGDKR